jgi:dimeric dUTPase (all-alpha-NTP-PPase superfamily)
LVLFHNVGSNGLVAVMGVVGDNLMQDQLTQMFELQAKTNIALNGWNKSMHPTERTKWILNYTLAMQQELAELVDSVPWKWWAKYQSFDEQNARVEVVDLFHFLISLAQVLGMSADEVFESYCKKKDVNLNRQVDGYVAKDQEDCKHI